MSSARSKSGSESDPYRVPKSAATTIALIRAGSLVIVALIRLITALVARGKPTSSSPPTVFVKAAPEPAPTPEAERLSPYQSARFGLSILAITFVLVALAGAAYSALRLWRGPAALTAIADNMRRLPDLTLTSGADAPPMVRWEVISGHIKQLTVVGSADGMAEVVLPLAPSTCSVIAQTVRAECADGRLLISPPPVTFSWSSPQWVFGTAGRAVTSDSLDIAANETSAGALQVMLSARTSARPSLCFSSPLAPATLTLQYGSRRFTRSFTGHRLAGMCGNDLGLAVLVGSQGAGMSPGLEFGGIDYLALRATAPEATMQSFVGSIGLAPGGTTLIGTPSVVTLSASTRTPIATLLDVQTGARSLTLNSHAATSVLTNNGELVPSELERLQGIISFLSTFLSALMAALLAVGVAALLEPLRRWRQGRDGS